MLVTHYKLSTLSDRLDFRYTCYQLSSTYYTLLYRKHICTNYLVLRLINRYHLFYILFIYDFFYIVSLRHSSRQLIVESCASPSNNLISLSYSMPVFSANLFGPFFNVHKKTVAKKKPNKHPDLDKR